MPKTEAFVGFEVDADSLHRAVRLAVTIAPTKSPKPVLTNVLVQLTNEGITVVGSDLTMTAVVKVPLPNPETPGSFLVEGPRFERILKEFRGESVSIKSRRKKWQCIISTQDSKYTLVGQDPENYPKIPQADETQSVSIPAETLYRALQKTTFAISKEPNRYAMHGLLLDIRENRMHVVATDGKRMSFFSAPLESSGVKINAVIPAKAAELLRKTLRTREEVVSLACTGTHLHVQTEEVTLQARLLTGAFPPYEKVIPSSYEKKVTVQKDAFATALRRAMLLVQTDTQAIQFQFSRQGVRLVGRQQEIGDSLVVCEGLDYDYEELVIGYNPSFFFDVLKVLDYTPFVLELKDGLSPAIIREEHEDFPGEKAVHMLMPRNFGK